MVTGGVAMFAGDGIGRFCQPGGGFGFCLACPLPALFIFIWCCWLLLNGGGRCPRVGGVNLAEMSAVPGHDQASEGALMMAE